MCNYLTHDIMWREHNHISMHVLSFLLFMQPCRTMPELRRAEKRKRIDKLLTYLTYMKNAYILDSCVQHGQATHNNLSILLKRCGCVNMHVAQNHKHIDVGKYTVWWFRASWLRDFGSGAALTRQVVCNFMHTLHTHTFIVQHFAV